MTFLFFRKKIIYFPRVHTKEHLHPQRMILLFSGRAITYSCNKHLVFKSLYGFTDPRNALLLGTPHLAPLKLPTPVAQLQSYRISSSKARPVHYYQVVVMGKWINCTGLSYGYPKTPIFLPYYISFLTFKIHPNFLILNPRKKYNLKWRLTY